MPPYPPFARTLTLNVGAAVAPGNLSQLMSDADFPIHVLHAGADIALGAGCGPNGPLPAAPGAASTGATTVPAPSNANALAVWPAGQSGYTDVLESLPATGGRANAVARARQAKRNGLKDVGVLVSAQYSSLHPGYFVVFSGIYATQSEAAAGVSAAHGKGFPDAYQTRVTR